MEKDRKNLIILVLIKIILDGNTKLFKYIWLKFKAKIQFFSGMPNWILCASVNITNIFNKHEIFVWGG